jgi:hypothetical protein
MNQNNQPQIKVLITLVILATITAVLMILTDDILKTFANSKIFSICYAFLFYGVTGSICWATARKKDALVLGNGGMVVSALAFLFVTIMIVGENKSTDMIKITLSLVVATIGLTQICFLFYINAQNKFTVTARMVATMAIAAYSLLIISKIFSPWENFMDWPVGLENYLKAILSLFIIGLGSCFLVPLCNQLETTDNKQ